MDLSLETAVRWLYTFPLALFAILVWLYVRPVRYPREPPTITPTIPYVGHLLGMLFYGSRYIKQLGLRQKHTPIFTMFMPGSRMYVVTDPLLAAAVQRCKTLSFTPLIPDITKNVLGLDDASVAIARMNIDPGPGEPRGFLADFHDLVARGMKPGEELNVLSRNAVSALKTHLDQQQAYLMQHEPYREVDLLEWVRHIVTLATASHFFGSRNPISQDPELVRAFWDFDHGLAMLLADVWPSVTARKAYRGREKLVAALADYLEAGYWEDGACELVQERIRTALAHGWQLREVARSELSFWFAGIVNVTTTTFWILLQVYADAELLARIRREVESVMTLKWCDRETIRIGRKSSVSAVEVARAGDGFDCPMLSVVYQECLRLGSENSSTRLVKEDTLLADTWFLAEGSVLQIAGSVMHADASLWGDNVAGFHPERFLQTDAGSNSSEKSTAKQNGFRAFGGGKTLCPGRYFAMNQIQAFVIMVVLQFDLQPLSGDRLKVPKKNDKVLPVHILEPEEPVLARLQLRSGWDSTLDVRVVFGGE
ncbi:cytochrome p450 protein [Apiospora marii]|uniref:Cytochrome p450 protein n=1 Tax=Apiospora marii TaxID=335849 RepID=A0ABR1RTA9_9PEZI